MATTEEQQTDQSVHDTQLPPPSPPHVISTTTSVQILILPSAIPIVDTLGIIDTMLQKMTIEEDKETSTRKIGHITTSNPIVQTKGTPQIIIIDPGRLDEDKDTPKEEE